MEKTGKALDGSTFAEKEISVYRAAKEDGAAFDMEIREMANKAGERSVAITLDDFPAVKIRGTAPDEQGNFELKSLDYLGSSAHGWNEYRLDLFGAGKLKLGDTAASLSLPGAVEAVQISSGSIKRYDTRITGTEAVSSLRNRRERILALAEWMNSEENPYAGNAAAEVKSQDDFEKYWKPVLFPEITRKKKIPVIYIGDSWQHEDDQWQKAEGIRWNTGYTEKVFPELLRNIRNSGTMLRDWEEAPDWLFVECNWDRILELLSEETTLVKKVKGKK
ncbi:MAG: hypothetical protein FWH38_02430 [Treponema sp.]|nr:hypothetical protein [Treponema sp.]